MYGGTRQTVLWWNQIQSLNEAMRCQCKACYKACKGGSEICVSSCSHCSDPSKDTSLLQQLQQATHTQRCAILKAKPNRLRKILSLDRSRNSVSLRRDLAWRLGVRNLKHLMHPLMVWETPWILLAFYFRASLCLPSLTARLADKAALESHH